MERLKERAGFTTTIDRAAEDNKLINTIHNIQEPSGTIIGFCQLLRWKCLPDDGAWTVGY